MTHSRIRPATGALTLTEMNGGRLQTVTVDREVIQFKQELLSRWGGRVFLLEDLERGEFVICGRENGNEYIIFTTKHLSHKTIERIEQADQASTSFVDVIDKLEEAWAKEDEREDRVLSEIAGDAGERLAWAFRKDGLIDHDNIYGPAPRRSEANRAIRRSR